MRVTSHMVTNNALRNMQKSMQRVSDLNEQATTGKKISVASEDPVIAIRALKLRTTCNQLEQYKSKNIPDALSWLDLTQTSIQNVEDRLEDVYYYCTQGSSDTFSTDQREKILNELQSLKAAIYQEGSTTYAGRYLFSGYKTETNLIFENSTAAKGVSYDISQDVSPTEIKVKNVVLNEINADDVDAMIAGSLTYQKPTDASVYALKLAYDNLSEDNLSLTYTSSSGTTNRLSVNTISATDADKYYDVEPGSINYIAETGELIFGEDIYNTIKDGEKLSVDYTKKEFEVGDLRPEMYFDCTRYSTNSSGVLEVVEFEMNDERQEIQYEVNFSQYLTVNTEGRDVIKHSMGNDIDELASAVQDVLDIENTITKLKGLLDEPQYINSEEAKKFINTLIEDADVELALKKENMQTLFGNNMTNFQNYMDDVSAVQAKVGTTYSKAEMLEVRVTEQLANFEELKSSNEDVETEEIAIQLYQSELAYESALATTGSVIQKTLLDYL